MGSIRGGGLLFRWAQEAGRETASEVTSRSFSEPEKEGEM